jgi:hypothetical protein
MGEAWVQEPAVPTSSAVSLRPLPAGQAVHAAVQQHHARRPHSQPVVRQQHLAASSAQARQNMQHAAHRHPHQQPARKALAACRHMPSVHTAAHRCAALQSTDGMVGQMDVCCIACDGTTVPDCCGSMHMSTLTISMPPNARVSSCMHAWHAHQQPHGRMIRAYCMQTTMVVELDHGLHLILCQLPAVGMPASHQERCTCRPAGTECRGPLVPANASRQASRIWQIHQGCTGLQHAAC